ncbi:MAG TPA: HDIG domain-containing protein [Vitreimonas sp.]|nr:HDIG domain-containing protein [Vitreimonas sp.]
MIQLIDQNQFSAEFALHKKYAQSELLLDLVWTHSHIIMSVSLNLYDSGRFDVTQMPRELVSKAALLHDIGVYGCSGFEWLPGQPLSDKPYAQHTLIGAEILQREGFSQEIIDVAKIHTGVGLSSEDITTYGMELPAGEYMPSTPLQWLITYASKFHSKAPRFKTATDIEVALSKYGTDKVERFKQLQATFGLPNLEDIKPRYEEWHKNFNFRITQLANGSAGNAAALPNVPVELSSAGISLSKPKAVTVQITPLEIETPTATATTANSAPMTLATNQTGPVARLS